MSDRAKRGKGGSRRSPRDRGRRAGAHRGLVTAVAVVLLLGVLGGGGTYGYQWWQARTLGAPDTVRIETTKGLIVMEVYPALMPVTVSNFEGLADAGFYDGLAWHRVEGWVVQTGDPTGLGTGGSSQRIPLEVSPKLGNVRGAVGMARSQEPDSATSQFYILKTAAPWLDGHYAVFGNVVEGLDVVDALAPSDKMLKVSVVRAG